MAEVHFNATAEDDVAEIARYIGVEKQNPQAARDYIDALRSTCEPYARQPLMGIPQSELGEDLRSFTFRKTYVVVYRPVEDGIDVLRVIHSSRQWRRVFRVG